jgi:hypothetical protein
MFLHKDVSEEFVIETNEPVTEVSAGNGNSGNRHVVRVQFEYQRGCFGAPLSLLN